MCPSAYRLSPNKPSATRHDLNPSIRFTVRRVVDITEKLGDCQNVSLQGTYFRTNTEIPEGATLDLLMLMSQEITNVLAALWLCTGHVARVEADPLNDHTFGVAVQFDFYMVSRSSKFHWAIGSRL